MQLVTEIISVICFPEFWKMIQNDDSTVVRKNSAVDHVVAQQLDKIIFRRLLLNVGMEAYYDVVALIIQIIIVNSFFDLLRRRFRIIQKIHQKIIGDGTVFQEIRMLFFQQMLNAVAKCSRLPARCGY
mgnify:CR=1 FL=1